MQYARVVRGVGRVTRALGAEQPHTGLRETGGLEDGNPSSADSANLDLLRSTAVIDSRSSESLAAVSWRYLRG